MYGIFRAHALRFQNRLPIICNYSKKGIPTLNKGPAVFQHRIIIRLLEDGAVWKTTAPYELEHTTKMKEG